MNKPTDAEQSWQEWRETPTRKQRYYKLAVCLLLYAGIWMTFHSNHPYAELAENQVRRALTVPYDFSKASAWYARHIGQWPSLLPAFNQNRSSQGKAIYAKPAGGAIIRSYSTSTQGIWMTAEPARDVRTISTGLVRSVNQAADGTWTVVIRHTDQVESIYSGLDQAAVNKNDWLNSGVRIGTAKRDADRGVGVLYFAIRRNQVYLDPRDVIALD